MHGTHVLDSYVLPLLETLTPEQLAHVNIDILTPDELAGASTVNYDIINQSQGWPEPFESLYTDTYLSVLAYSLDPISQRAHDAITFISSGNSRTDSGFSNGMISVDGVIGVGWTSWRDYGVVDNCHVDVNLAYTGGYDSAAFGNLNGTSIATPITASGATIALLTSKAFTDFQDVLFNAAQDD